jgi:hypothetical protein
MVKLCASCGAASSRCFKVAAHERGKPRLSKSKTSKKYDLENAKSTNKCVRRVKFLQGFTSEYNTHGTHLDRRKSSRCQGNAICSSAFFSFYETGGKCCDNRRFAEKWKNYFVAAFSVVWKIIRPVRTLLVINSFDAKAEADDFKGRLRERCIGFTLLLR